MASRVFLDANIILDFSLMRDNYDNAKQLIEKIEGGQLSAYISPSIVHISGYWLTKMYGAAKAKELLLSLLSSITVIEIDHEITVHALHSKIHDIEDSLQYYTAIHHKLDAFISNDKQLKKEATAILPIYNLEEFLQLMDSSNDEP
jgi:predicted nucleic acid-binding protein